MTLCSLRVHQSQINGGRHRYTKSDARGDEKQSILFKWHNANYNVLSVTTNQKQLREHTYKALPCVMICIPHSVNRLIGDT